MSHAPNICGRSIRLAQEGDHATLVSATAAAVDVAVVAAFTSWRASGVERCGDTARPASAAGAPAHALHDRRVSAARAARAHARRSARARRGHHCDAGRGGPVDRGRRERRAVRRRRRHGVDGAARVDDSRRWHRRDARTDREPLASEPRVPPRRAMVSDRVSPRCGGLGDGRHTMSGEPDPNTPLRLTVGAFADDHRRHRAAATKRSVIEKIAKAMAPLEARIAELESREYQGVWTGNKSLPKGATVTRGGNLWIARVGSIGMRPGANTTAWQLCVRRGRDGKRRPQRCHPSTTMLRVTCLWVNCDT